MMTCEENEKRASDESGKPQKFFILFLVGFFMILIGLIALVVTAVFYGEGSANFGAIIFIGPVPIVVGAGPEATGMILVAIVLGVISVAIFWLLRRKNDKGKGLAFV